MSIDIERFNADWLKAWTNKDVERLLDFYSADAFYADPQTAGGIRGHDALRAYLQALFAGTPKMTYNPETVWAIENGFCGRWYCEVDDGEEAGRLRGFDLVIFDGGRIGHNEVYVHDLPVAA